MENYIDSEYGTLKSVLLGSVSTFYLHKPINIVQKYYYSTEPPKLEKLLREQEEFVKVLREHNIEVLWVESQNDSPNQINVRDIATVIGNTFVIGAMKEPIRQMEPRALEKLTLQFASPILKVDNGIIEGGDVILGGQNLFVGLSQRTNEDGLKWLEEHFAHEFAIIPIQLVPPFLHLDVVFNLLSGNVALVYPPAIAPESYADIRSRYDLVEVTTKEQFELATNVLSLSPQIVITDKRHDRLNALLSDRGFEVIALDFFDISKIGGAFRCGTCPLIRDRVDD